MTLRIPPVYPKIAPGEEGLAPRGLLFITAGKMKSDTLIASTSTDGDTPDTGREDRFVSIYNSSKKL